MPLRETRLTNNLQPPQIAYIPNWFKSYSLDQVILSLFSHTEGLCHHSPPSVGHLELGLEAGSCGCVLDHVPEDLPFRGPCLHGPIASPMQGASRTRAPRATALKASRCKCRGAERV